MANAQDIKRLGPGANLVGADLRGAICDHSVNLRGANLTNANMAGIKLWGVRLDGANLTGANLQGAFLFGCYFGGCNLTDANLTGAELQSATFEGANLTRTNLSSASMSGSNLRPLSDSLLRSEVSGRRHNNDTHLVNQQLYADPNRRHFYLFPTAFTRATLFDTKMDSYIVGGEVLRFALSAHISALAPDAVVNNARLYQANLQGVRCPRVVLRGADMGYANWVNADLSGADLSGANLDYADLTGANLSGATLSNTSLTGANFQYADLSNAILSGAKVYGEAKFMHANLSGAMLSGAKLSHADLSHTDLSHADMSNMDLRDAILTGANMTNTVLLNSRFEDEAEEDTSLLFKDGQFIEENMAKNDLEPIDIYTPLRNAFRSEDLSLVKEARILAGRISIVLKDGREL